VTTLSPPLDRRDHVDVAAIAIMLFLTFSWGLNGVAAKLAGEGYSPVFMTLARSALGAALVFAWCFRRGVPLFNSDGTLLPGLLAGLLFGAEFIVIYFGLDYTSAGRSALMVNTMPFWVLLGAHFLLGERMSGRKVLGLALAFAGVALVFSDQLSLPGPEALFGDALSLLGGALWGATTIVIKRSRLATASAEKLLLYQLSVSALMCLPLLAFTEPALRDPTSLATSALLFQGGFVVAVTYLIWFWLMRRYPAAGLASFAFLTPAFGVLLGGLLLGEPLSLRIGLALALIAAGLVIVNRPAA
jgi:drug/metabolite transporter (DMT)-like permease